jgi:hypothetical protein
MSALADPHGLLPVHAAGRLRRAMRKLAL